MENKTKYFSTAILAGLMFFACFASAQSQGDLDAACAQGNAAKLACDNVSSQVSSHAAPPAGITVSCSWTGSSCIPNIVISDSIKNPGTESTDLASACAKGAGSEDICSSIAAGMASSGNISGITVACVWNHPSASSMCSPRVTLDTSTITSKMVGGFIKSMVFIQDGVATTSVRVVSSPFKPYVIHTVVDGSGFPGGKDSDCWMTVTGTKDVNPQTFDMDSIDPDAMASAEQNKLKNLFSGDGPTEIGPGIGPDFSAVKALQTFNWSMTIPYDTGKTYEGTAQCNGTYNETVDKCMNGSSDANWIKMPLCTNPASCPSGSYLKDVPSVGYLTIFNADPVPVYRTSGTNTTSTTTTTTTVSTSATSSTTTTTITGVAGDANGDSHVNYADLLILASTYGKNLGNAGYDARGDLNRDNKVDYSDLLLLAGHYGH